MKSDFAVKVVTVSSVKGGVGKSTIAINVANELAKKRKVVYLDLDAQASGTDYFFRNVEFDELEKANAYHVLTERLEPHEAIREVISDNDGPYVQRALPASLKLHTVGYEMAGDPGAILRIAKEIRSIQADYVVIDSPPGLSYEFRVAVYAADLILSPVTFDRWAMQGIGLLLGEIEKAEKSGSRITVKVAPSMVTASEDEKIREAMNIPITKTSISRTAAVRTALARGSRLKEGSKSQLEFASLAKEL